MAEVIIYSKVNCPYCLKAKRWFESKKVPYTEHVMDERGDELNQLKQKTGHMTVPQIFINGKFIGGYSDLIEADGRGEIQPLLK